MRKSHYRVVFDVYLTSDEKTNVREAIENNIAESGSLTESNSADSQGNNMDIIDIQLKEVECTDSR